jgi:ABC-type transport system involved in multi-copper enzyme maturation permease subunit
MWGLIKGINYKIKKNMTVRIAVITTLVVAVVGMLIMYGVVHILSSDIIEAAGGYESDLDAFEDLTSVDCGIIALSFMQILSIILAIVITINISYEKRNGMYAFMVCKGISYRRIYLAKIYESIVTAVVLCTGYVVAAMAIGGFLWTGRASGDDICTFIKVFLLMICMYAASSTIYTCIAMNVKNAAIAITINLGLILVFSSIVTAVDIEVMNDAVLLRKWWILSAIEQFADIDVTYGDMLTGFIDAVLYGVGFSIVGTGLFKRQS